MPLKYFKSHRRKLCIWVIWNLIILHTEFFKINWWRKYRYEKPVVKETNLFFLKVITCYHNKHNMLYLPSRNRPSWFTKGHLPTCKRSINNKIFWIKTSSNIYFNISIGLSPSVLNYLSINANNTHVLTFSIITVPLSCLIVLKTWNSVCRLLSCCICARRKDFWKIHLGRQPWAKRTREF